jgi:N-acetyl-gamma-glutamyl-phosphate reductase
MVRVAVVGGTGYTGVELLRLLAQHPDVSVAMVTSRGEAGTPVSNVYPSLRGYCDLPFTQPELSALAEVDLVFFATPNGIAMQSVPALLDAGVRVIDLSADFRLPDAALWARWYGQPHVCPELLSEAVYGLTERQAEAVRNARLVANPGCYPTAIQLGFLPLLEADMLLDRHIVADCKSGVSGAGRGAAVKSLLCESAESMSAYGVAGHRHLPEISHYLEAFSGIKTELAFVPHLTPMIRGIHATLYARVEQPDVLQSIYEAAYKDAPFVDVLPKGQYPETRSVKASNLCRISIETLTSGRVVIMSVIDNLVKGAAGQAVQNMNLMFGFKETSGLELVPVSP